MEVVAAKERQEVDARTLVTRLGPLWPIVILLTVSAQVSGPALAYVSLNFFARQYTSLEPEEVHCELTPRAYYCKKALVDDATWKTVMGTCSCICSFLLAPAVGAISDAYGRRRVIIICAVSSQVALLGMCLHIFAGVSLYIMLLLGLFADIPISGVYMTVVTDLLHDLPEGKAGAFGILMAAMGCFGIPSLILGSALTLQASLLVSVVLSQLALIYMMTCFPETLAQEKRTPLTRQSLLPGVGLGILFRSRLSRRLSLAIIISSFVFAGMDKLSTSFFMTFLEWNQSASYNLAIISQLCTMVWLGGLLKPTIHRLGEAGTFRASLATGAIFYIILPFVTEVWHALLIIGIAVGPLSFGFPSTSALLSHTAPSSEQGRLQGALTAATSIAGGVAPILTGYAASSIIGMNGSEATGELRFELGLLYFYGAALMLVALCFMTCRFPVIPEGDFEKLEKLAEEEEVEDTSAGLNPESKALQDEAATSSEEETSSGDDTEGKRCPGFRLGI